MAAGEIFECTVVAVQGTVSIANVYFLKVLDDTGSADEYLSAFEALDLQLLAKLRETQSDKLTYECVVMRVLSPITKPSRVFPMSDTGDLAQPVLPSSQALQVNTKSGFGQRWQVGKIFLGGIPEFMAMEGRLDRASRPLFDNYITALTGVLAQSGHTYRLQQHSRKFNLFADYEVATIRPQFTKLRNRTPGLCSIS